MADLNLFQYFPAASTVHRLDPRTKLLGLFLLCIVIFFLRLPGLFVATLGLLWFIRLSKVPFGPLLKRMTWIFILAGVILLSRILSTEGTPLFRNLSRPAWEGLLMGLEGAWRLVLFVLTGMVFVSSTTVLQIRDGLYRWLKPVPFIPAETLSVMIGLTISFVPVIFSQAAEVMEAQRSRCIGRSGNPLRRLRFAAGPLVRSLLLRVEDVADAMEARAFGGTRTLIGMHFSRRDLYALFCILFLAAAGFAADRFILPVLPHPVFWA